MSVEPSQQDPVAEPVELHRHAADNLSFIRETMERSASFTAVPGWGTAGTGILALAGAYAAALRRSEDWWIWTWVAMAVAAFTLGFVTLHIKARRVRVSVWTGAGSSRSWAEGFWSFLFRRSPARFRRPLRPGQAGYQRTSTPF